MIGRCKTCKHWGGIKRTLATIYPNNGTAKPCGLIKSNVSGFGEGTLMQLIAESNSSRPDEFRYACADLVTHAEFGCVHHEEKS